MRTALGRARRLVAFLLLALAAGWLVVRRRSGPVGAAAPALADQPGPLPAGVLATDAGLTELPDGEAPELDAAARAEVAEAEAEAAGTGAVAAVEEALAEARPVAVAAGVTGAEPAVADEEPTELIGTGAQPDPGDEPIRTDPTGQERTERIGTDDIDGPTGELPRPVFAEAPSPAFSDAPTMEMPVAMDDLRAVRGIGPSMERMLHGLGIVSFRQLARLDGTELERVRHELRDFRSRIEREDWIGQARQLHKAKYGTDPA